ncbi:DNA polymerase IV [Actinoplanes sp. DH11]|uniref:DNA polymerase IV n=1 Tax=Actinoplanes sp. DH11 TaxID=2857011 RepID=UPI001E338696|nr:DNA polymerase IV [Actinoplanes sp. DH11]
MRGQPSILHVDLDAMFAAVEQRDKVSLRGKPVVVGGVAGRGVVSTASYEARVYGVRSAMPMAQARRRCPPGTAYLSPRFAAYKRTSEIVMELLAGVSPLVEQVSIDEAYLDLAAAGHDLTPAGVTELALQLKRDIAEATGGITGSVGVASSKLLAKIGSELNKPDGLTVVPAGDELTVLHPLPVSTLGGVGPATEQRLHRAGVRTVGALAAVPLEDLVDWFGTAHGNGLFRLARAEDNRPVVGEREAKSVSAEETFDVDLADPVRLNRELDLLAARVTGRLRDSGLTGRTVNIKVRHPDFTTVTRAITRDQPTDDGRLVAQLARRLLAEVNTTGGVRLLGVGVSTLADFAQDDLFSGVWPVTAPPSAAPDLWPNPSGPSGPSGLSDPSGSAGSSGLSDPSGSSGSVAASGALLPAEPGLIGSVVVSGPGASSSGFGQPADAPGLGLSAGPFGSGLSVGPPGSGVSADSPGSGVSADSPGSGLAGADDADGRAAGGVGVSAAVDMIVGSSAVDGGAVVAPGAVSPPDVAGSSSPAGSGSGMPAGSGSGMSAENSSGSSAGSGSDMSAGTGSGSSAGTGSDSVAGGSGGVGMTSGVGDPEPRVWRPGQDVRHDDHGAGWVWGSGLGRVTVRFEGPTTPPGPVRTFAADDPHLHPADPPDWRAPE